MKVDVFLSLFCQYYLCIFDDKGIEMRTCIFNDKGIAIVYVLEENKSGVSITHLSRYGTSEREVFHINSISNNGGILLWIVILYIYI